VLRSGITTAKEPAADLRPDAMICCADLLTIWYLTIQVWHEELRHKSAGLLVAIALRTGIIYA